MTQMLEKPAPSAAVAMPRNRVRVSAAPPAHENTGSCSPNRIPTGAVACAATSTFARATRTGAVRTTAGSSTMSNSRARVSRSAVRSRTCRAARDQGRSCRARGCGGDTPPGSRTRQPRARRRAGVRVRSMRPVARARVRACRPPSSDAAAAVGRRSCRAARTRRCWPRGPVRLLPPPPAGDRSTRLLGREVPLRPRDFPAPDGPTSTTRHGAGNTTDSVSSIPVGHTTLLGRAAALPPDVLSSESKSPRTRTSGL